MKRLAFKHLLVSASLVLAATSQVRAQGEEFESPKQARFSYAVKFVCMGSSEEVQEGVVKGVYATDINVHNPSLGKRAIFFKKVAQAFPYQKPGPVSKFQRGRLGPNEAIEVECNEIRQMLPTPQAAFFRTGFLVILSQHELDVTAVYTARPSSPGEVSAIAVETIAPRKLAAAPTKLADLIVRDIDLDSLSVSCPGGAGTCVTKVQVTIANIGAGDAGPFNTLNVLDPVQSVMVNQPSPGGLGAGMQSTFNVTTPPGGNCFDSDCTICVFVDDNDAVTESDETNNQLCRTKPG